MENIFNNRRRHWIRDNFWSSENLLISEVEKVYANIKEPIIGNKVCTPDVWSPEDIYMFCRIFINFKILFVVRNPKGVILSRYKRENYDLEFTNESKRKLLLDFRSRTQAYLSSWRQSLEAYWKLKETVPERVKLLYYEDFCINFKKEIMVVFNFLKIHFSENILNWHKYPHHDAKGNLVKHLKYEDTEIYNKKIEEKELPNDFKKFFTNDNMHFILWKQRRL